MKKIILLIFMLVLTACSSAASSDVDQNIEKWQDANITHYRYNLDIMCFCPFRDQMPLTIEVKDGKVVSITEVDGTLVTPTDQVYEFYSPFSTIDNIFVDLKKALAEADEVVVSYDPTYGYPVTINIDQIKDAVDDEQSLQISNFEVLE